MSAITNKDRITENNDKINRLIELAKQKGLTSNPKQATTEDEMDAMIADKNVGKVVKYLGESGGKYEKNALYIIAEGDETDSGLFARRLNITEGSLSITENGTYDVTDKASVDVNVAGSSGSDSNKLALVVGAQSANNSYEITASDLDGITELGENALYKKAGLKSVVLPSACTKIGNAAFYLCTNLSNVEMQSVTEIGLNGFRECTSLTTINMPEVTTIGNDAFYKSALASVNAPKLNSTRGGTFNACVSLTEIDLPELTTMGGSEFYQCTSLTKVSIPKVKNIGGSSFYYCSSLADIEIPDTCTSIGTHAFTQTAITKANLQNVTTIANYGFYQCSKLAEVYMPKVTSIGQKTFQSCYALTELTIPSTCTSIAVYALQCGSSTNKCTFTFEGTTPPSIQSTTFNASYINKIIVPIGCGEAYKTATNWTTYADYIEEATE